MIFFAHIIIYHMLMTGNKKLCGVFGSNIALECHCGVENGHSNEKTAEKHPCFSLLWLKARKSLIGLFLKFLLKRTFWWKPCGKFSVEVGIKCHQSCTVALVLCTRLYIKLAVFLCSFSQFPFPFNFQTANALVLKFGTFPLCCLFSNKLLAIFDIFFRSKVIHRLIHVPKNGPKMTCGRVFQHNFKV